MAQHSGILDAPHFAALSESPARIVDDVCMRALPAAHIITFANEKGGVGKSTLAFNCAVALANAGASVLAVDLDFRQRTLVTALENRRATATCLAIPLNAPQYTIVDKPSGAILSQEMARLGANARFIIIDSPGSDTPLGRRAIAMANTLVTPLNASFLDLQQLARFHPVTHEMTASGPFGATVHAIQQEKLARDLAPADWVLVKNRVRSSEQRQQKQIDDALACLSATWGARIASGLAERVGYRELFAFGLTHADLPNIPQLRSPRKQSPEEIRRFLAELRLPPMGIGSLNSKRTKARVRECTRENYLRSLQSQLGILRAAVTS